MKQEYDLKRLRKRPGGVRVVKAAKVPFGIRIDGVVLWQLRDEAERLGIDHPTLIGSILQRYVDRELADPGAVDLR